MKRLSQDAVALVHHIELNESDWWQETLTRVMLTCLLRDTEPQDLSGLRSTIETEFGIRISAEQARDALKSLVSAGQAIELASGFQPTNDARAQSAAALSYMQSLEADVARRFSSALCDQCGSLMPPPSWTSFRDDCLLPLIRHEGAQIVALSGAASNGDLPSNAIITHYIEAHDPGNVAGLAQCVDGFLRSSDTQVHEYVLRQLAAHFVVVAAGLDASTINALTATKSKKLTLRLVLDTNFIFSVLGWHDHPSNDAARSLLAVSTSSDSAVDVELLVLPTTIEETRTALALKAERLGNIRWSHSLAEAALDFGVPGLVEQYLESRSNSDFSISITEYTDMVSHDLEMRLQNIGVNSVYDDVSTYSMRADVIDSINDQIDYERTRRAPEDRRDYQLVKHDMVAYHWVLDQRPPTIQTAIDAGFWLVTLDFRLLGFDRFKSRGSRRTQVCLHPSTAVQLLQFWIPRSEVLEQAVFFSVTQPLYPAATLAATEQVTYRIIERLSTLDGIADISPDAIRDTLADRVLQGRMRDAKDRHEEIELVELAFVSLVKEREAELAAQKRENAVLAKELDRVRGELATKDEHVEGRRVQADKLKQQVVDAQAKLGSLEQTLTERDRALAKRDDRIDQIEQSARLRTWQDRFVVMPAVAFIVLGALCSLGLTRISPSPSVLAYPLLWTLLGLVWLVIVVATGRHVDALGSSTRFERLVSLNRYIWIAIGTVALGLITSILWDLLRPLLPWTPKP